jgi:hypothetical protein
MRGVVSSDAAASHGLRAEDLLYEPVRHNVLDRADDLRTDHQFLISHDSNLKAEQANE